MTVNQLIAHLQGLNGNLKDLKMMINTEWGLKPLTIEMVNNDFLLEWVNGKPVQSDEIVVIYAPN